MDLISSHADTVISLQFDGTAEIIAHGEERIRGSSMVQASIISTRTAMWNKLALVLQHQLLVGFCQIFYYFNFYKSVKDYYQCI